MESPTTPTASNPSTSPTAKRWKPLSRDQRRVLGVLIEKSKTTPDVYPMSINGIKNGCNQKSNRSPLLELEENRVEDVLYELRQLGCVIEVHAGGRVPKYKHQAYEWLEISKAELSVLTELLLRGEQTLGELRARAARMESAIEGLDELRPILASLKQKDLIIELTPSGRGQVITHNLYQHNELERLQLQYQGHQPAEEEEPDSSDSAPRRVAAQAGGGTSQLELRVEQLETRLAGLEQQVAQLKRLIES
jgi:hypothetical protein